MSASNGRAARSWLIPLAIAVAVLGIVVVTFAHWLKGSSDSGAEPRPTTTAGEVQRASATQIPPAGTGTAQAVHQACLSLLAGVPTSEAEKDLASSGVSANDVPRILNLAEMEAGNKDCG